MEPMVYMIFYKVNVVNKTKLISFFVKKKNKTFFEEF